MQIKTISVALWMVYATSVSIAVAAEGVTPAQLPTPQIPQTPEAWLQRMTDFSRNGMAFKDPRAFMAWSNAVTEPGFYPVLVQGMANPTMTLNMVNSAMSPAAVRNMASFADPAIAARWMGAAVDPRFYAQMATQFVNPGKMMRWMLLPVDPRAIQAAGQMVNPAEAVKWVMVPADPRMWKTAGNMVNPATYTGMVGVAMNPQSYGPTWGAVAQPMQAPVSIATKAASDAAQGAVAQPMQVPVNMPTPVTTQITKDLPRGMAMNAAVAPMATPVATTKPAAVANPVVPVTVVADLPAKSAAVPAVAATAPANLAPVAVPMVHPAAAAIQIPVADVAAASASLASADGKNVLSTDMLFQPGKADVKALTQAGKKALDAIVAQIKAASDVSQVVVMGHTDPTGKAKGNRVLSQKRAKAVKSYLTAQGVNPNLIVTSGLGDTQPVVRCDPKAAKADKIGCNAPNRRIEVEVRKLPPK